ncbi:MAG: dTMP kinase [Sediminibacterium sp.]|nr:dTMP kinase [Sediminibacterium sp.]
MPKPLFIAFEGIDGSGKSTQAKLLAEKLKQEGHKVYVTFEPTSSRIGSIIRDIFNHRQEGDHRTIAGLFVADRLHHLLNSTDGILKKMSDGFTVITDRYYLSSYAYQGAHVPLQWVIQANSLSVDLLKPHIHIFIDISEEECMKRLHSGRNYVELYENLENLKKVRKKYYEAFELVKENEQIVTFDGTLSPEIVSRNIWNHIHELIAKK